MTGPDSPLRYWLGQRAAVIIDRPLGSQHPEYPELVYPVNYGYIPNTQAGDRQPLDAYVLGIDVPIASFIGEVIAIVVRHDDVEYKLVVSSSGTHLPQADIERAVYFQERFFTSDVVMSVPSTDDSP